MSLKAKIEAVIYASEEPVTLAQLTGLLGQEAQAELDRLESAQQSLALDGESRPESVLESELGVTEISGSDGTSGEDTSSHQDGAAEEPPAAPEIAPQPTDEPESHEPEPTDESPVPEHPNAEAEPEADAPRDAKAVEDLPAVAARSGREAKQEDKVRERKLREYFRSILDELIADYARSERGLEIREVAGGYRLATKPEYHDAVRGFVKSLKPPLKLSLQALETLAVVAYKQPVTAPEISEIRGVDSGGVLGSLMARKLITTAGRKQVIGRPILYKTTRDFLLRFGLKDVSELPSIEEFEKMAGELADSYAEPVAYPIQEEIPMSHHAPETAEELEQQRNSVEPQSDGTSIPLDGADESSSGVPGETVADEVLTDGRISGLPPQYDQDGGDEAPFDSPEMDAELQQEEAAERVNQRQDNS